MRTLFDKILRLGKLIRVDEFLILLVEVVKLVHIDVKGF